MIDSVLLLAFGGPDRFEDVRPFLANVLRGKNVPPERVEAVVEQYRAIGGRSPLLEITQRQASELEIALRSAGHPLEVYVGMRNWSPTIFTALQQMKMDGRSRAVAVVLSPFRSEPSWDRYIEQVNEARADLDGQAPEIVFAPLRTGHETLTAAIAERIRGLMAREKLQSGDENLPWIFTAHSIPQDLDAKSGYSRQFAELAERVAGSFRKKNWHLAYQSRSGSPRDPWLEPDIGDRLRELKERGHQGALAIPIGFVADHVEVLYDLDIKARKAADGLGMRFWRAPTVNDHPQFIQTLMQTILPELSPHSASLH